ncbi:DNA binding domain, excisionase family (plasmid) [Xanthobacter versatilis]|uniref:DNA binding domain, excisionase family n=1 Tax=Xanthobacter autotrophicus (strain ATCC BAA-1158 / Py2) TaxID=78245 RepID=A7IPX9_XANP2|nr:DNA binding domain, excisionase family [Xanthobacter autotrophicus Py2]
MNEENNLLTLEEAAQYLGFSKTTLRRWTSDGQLACLRVGLRGERRFDRKVLDAFLAGRSEEVGEVAAPALAPPAAAAEPAPLAGQAHAHTHAHLHRHICLHYRNPAEQWESFRTYFLDHYRAGAPTTYMYSSSTRADLLERVHNEGIDPEEAVRSGLLRLVPASESYLRQSEFSADFMISFVRLIMIRMRADGYQRHLTTGEMDWHFMRSAGNIDELHLYERKLNRLSDEYPEATIVCHYDITKFDSEAVLNACLTHPNVYFGERSRKGGVLLP